MKRAEVRDELRAAASARAHGWSHYEAKALVIPAMVRAMIRDEGARMRYRGMRGKASKISADEGPK